MNSAQRWPSERMTCFQFLLGLEPKFSLSQKRTFSKPITPRETSRWHNRLGTALHGRLGLNVGCCRPSRWFRGHRCEDDYCENSSWYSSYCDSHLENGFDRRTG